MTESPLQTQYPKSMPAFWIAGAVVVAGLLWGLAIVLPVWDTRSNQTGDWDVVRGGVPALLGWLGLLVECPAWFANLLLIPLCIMLFKRGRKGFLLSVVALAVAASAYGLPGIYGDNDEAVIMRRLAGFYLWLGSFLVIALAHAFRATPSQPKWIAARGGVVMLMVLGIAGLERICPVGASPLESTLRNADDLTTFTATLAGNPPQADKDTALWWAVRQELSANRREPSRRITMLIAAGANPNKPDAFGDTLLMRALRNEAFVKVLVAAGADVNARDSRGKTILEIAQQVGSSPESQKILVNAGARASGQK